MPANAPLVEIMQGLSTDMSGTLVGLWLENPDLLSLTTDIQEGCVSCHETFRERILEVRAGG